jgi:hypothetical protein
MVCRKIQRTRRQFADLKKTNGSLFSELLRGRPFILRGNGQFQSVADMEAAYSENADSIRAWWKSNMPPGTRSYCELLFSILPKLKINITMPTLPYSSKSELPGAWPHRLFICDCDHSQADFLFRRGVINSREYAQAKQINAASC